MTLVPLEQDNFISVALAEAATQLGLREIVSSYDEARQVERAIENLADLYDQIHLSLLKLMWRMERDGLYAELHHSDMLSWALANPKLRSKWRPETIDRYAKAITRILPELERQPYITEDGEVIDAEALLEKGTITSISDYSYTFYTTDDPDARQDILRSILRHDGDTERDKIIRSIRLKQAPVTPVRFVAEDKGDYMAFSGRCSYEQWKVIRALLGQLMEEHFVKEQNDDPKYP